MPWTVNEAAMKKQHTVNVMRPQEATPADLPENWAGTPNRGLPVKEIPFMEYPQCVYMHPNKPTKVIVHRNEKHEVVEEEIVPTEHLSKVVNTPEELTQALKDGWVKRPYIAPPLPKPDADLYGPKKG
jgi:hypothetical protein